MPTRGIFFFQKMECCVFFLFIINHCVCRNQTTLQIGNTHEYTVQRQICCLSRTSCVRVVVSGPSMVSVVFRLVRSWLFCNSGFWLRVCLPHVSGCLRLVEVFAAIPFGVSCFLSCGVGETLCPVGTLVRRQVVSSRHSCCRRPPRHARASRVLEVGSQWHGCKCS